MNNKKISPEKQKEYLDRYRSKPGIREKMRQGCKEYYQKNKEKILEKKRVANLEYYRNNKEIVLERNRQYKKRRLIKKRINKILSLRWVKWGIQNEVW